MNILQRSPIFCWSKTVKRLLLPAIRQQQSALNVMQSVAGKVPVIDVINPVRKKFPMKSIIMWESLQRKLL
jgi:hypothetical protein